MIPAIDALLAFNCGDEIKYRIRACGRQVEKGLCLVARN